MKINLGNSSNKRFLKIGDRNRQQALNILSSVNKIQEYENQGNLDVMSLDKYKTKKNYISRKNHKQYGELMSINEVSPTNYSAIGSLMGHPKTAASEYQPSKNISRTDSQDNFVSGRSRKFNNNVFRSHNTN